SNSSCLHPTLNPKLLPYTTLFRSLYRMTASPGKTTCHSPTRSWIPRSSWSTSRSICIMTQGYHPCLGRGVSRYLLLPLPSTASLDRKSTRPELQSHLNLVCRLLLE